MAVKTRADIVDVETHIDTQHIVPTSRLVSSVTGFQFSPTRQLWGPMPSLTNQVSIRMVF